MLNAFRAMLNVAKERKIGFRIESSSVFSKVLPVSQASKNDYTYNCTSLCYELLARGGIEQYRQTHYTSTILKSIGSGVLGASLTAYGQSFFSANRNSVREGETSTALLSTMAVSFVLSLVSKMLAKFSQYPSVVVGSATALVVATTSIGSGAIDGIVMTPSDFHNFIREAYEKEPKAAPITEMKLASVSVKV